LNELVWEVLRYIHVLAVAFFVGGQLVVLAAVVPVERTAPDSDRMRAIGRRFGLGSLVALAFLAVTGAVMATDLSAWSSGVLQLKLGCAGAVVALTSAHLVWPTRRALPIAILAVSLAIVWLGLDLAH
jgi:putative copper export protein